MLLLILACYRFYHQQRYKDPPISNRTDQNQWTHQPSSGNIPCTKCLWQDLSPSNSTFCMNASGKIAPSNEDQQNTAKWAKTNWHFYMQTIQLADKILHTSIPHKHKWPITSCTHTYYYISKNIMECILQYWPSSAPLYSLFANWITSYYSKD